MTGLASFRQLFLFRFRTFSRDPAVIFWVFLFPVLALAALGLAFRPGPPGPFSVGVVGDLGASFLPGDLRVRSFSDVAEGDRALGRGEVSLVLVAGSPPRVRFDPARADSLTARLLVERALGSAPTSPAVLDPVLETGLRYVDFLVPGLIGMQLMNTTLLGVGVALVQMRARRMLRRFAVTPMPRSHLLLAHTTARVLFTFLMAALLLLVSRVLFGVQVRGSPLDVALLLVLGGFAFSGIALALAARTENVETATGMATMVALPMVLLSGVFFSNSGYPFSTSGMPEWIRVPASLLPLSVFNDALRAIMNEGAPVGARAVLLLVGWGTAPFAYAWAFFRWT